MLSGQQPNGISPESIDEELLRDVILAVAVLKGQVELVVGVQQAKALFAVPMNIRVEQAEALFACSYKYQSSEG